MPEVIVAIGGGSCIDTAKVLARLAESSPGENVESILASQIISKEFKSTAIIAIPTTTGTGSEVTPFATVWDYNKGKKYSIAGEDLKPEWDKAAESASDKMITVNCSDTDNPDVNTLLKKTNTTTFPRIFFMNGSKTKEYSGSRTAEEFLTFVNDNIKFKFFE